MTLLDPSNWPTDEVADLIAGNSSLRGGPESATFTRACVVGSTSTYGPYAGRKALEQGGSAVDAVLACAFTQIAAAAGCWVSYAGIFGMVHFDAAAKSVTSVDGGFRTFRGETDAATIPAAPEPSGRTALVPGFFAGAKAAHDRFGRLPWADLLLPAIWIADGNVPLGESLGNMLKMREPVLSRTPEARAALMPDGSLPTIGQPFVQAELARTLRLVAEIGPDHLYRGEWAQKFVDVVQREGGKVALEDLTSYAPIWSEPLVGSAHGYDIYAAGLPNTGGAALIEGVRVAAELGVGDPETDPEALHLLVQIARSNHALTGVAPVERVSDEHISRVAKLIQESGRSVLPSHFSPGNHSDFVAAVDADGNVASVCHSINTAAFGTTGIFVDGISIPDAACFQQAVLATIPPGAPLPNPMNPAIVLKDSEPVLASSSIGAGLLETTLTCVHRHLSQGVSVGDAVRGLLVHGPDFGVRVSDSINNDIDSGETDTDKGSADFLLTLTDRLKAATERGGDPRDVYALAMSEAAQAVTGEVSEEFLAEVGRHGTAISHMPDDDPGFMRGYWVGISRNPKTGALEGARTGFLNSRVEGL